MKCDTQIYLIEILERYGCLIGESQSRHRGRIARSLDCEIV